MNHDAIRKAYPGAVVINGDDQVDIHAWDANGDEITIDWQLVAAQDVIVETGLLITRLSTEIQKRLDDFAATRKYDNVVSLSKYTSLTDTEIASLPQADQAAALRYRAECRHLLLKVAQTWSVGERILGEVLSSQRPTPASIADFAAELPVLDWPV